MIKLKELNVDIKDLLLDPNNPRFLRSKDEKVSEKNIVLDKIQIKIYEKMLSADFEIEQLSDTIKKDGYLGFDRIFVQKIGNKYLVREGNRRITAVKLLIEKSQDGTKGNQLSNDILETFKKIPAIDVTHLTEVEVQQMLGLRHFDSVKDWKTLPQANHLFIEYMRRLLNVEEIDVDKVSSKYFPDSKITKELAILYALSESAVKELIQLYRVYFQIISDRPSASEQTNLISMIQNTISSPVTRERFGFDTQTAIFTPNGLDDWLRLIVGNKGEKPIIREVRKGDSTLGDYIKVLKEGTKQDVDRIEVDGEETSIVAGEIKARKGDKSLKRIISRMAKDLEELKLANIKKEELTQGDLDVLKDLKKHLDILLGGISNK